MGIRVRQALLLALVGAFVVQTWLVYSDPAGKQAPLSLAAAHGRELWHDHNCQSCHQLYGFGGFLGPDLTNAASGLSRERLESVLTVGAGQMPAFQLKPEEQEALTTFLAELSTTGIGQVKRGESVTAEELLERVVEGALAAEGPLGPSAARGFAIVTEQNCITCHLPNAQSIHRATDLTAMGGALEPARVRAVLRDGLPGKAMPRLGLEGEDADAVLDFLAWMHGRGAEIRRSFEHRAATDELTLSQLPWFEFE